MSGRTLVQQPAEGGQQGHNYEAIPECRSILASSLGDPRSGGVHLRLPKVLAELFLPPPEPRGDDLHDLLLLSEERSAAGVIEADLSAGTLRFTPGAGRLLNLREPGPLRSKDVLKTLLQPQRRSVLSALRKRVESGCGEAVPLDLPHSDPHTLEWEIKSASGNLVVRGVIRARQNQGSLPLERDLDPLTGLKTRAWLLAKITRDFGPLGDLLSSFGLILLDFDRFGAVNSGLGSSEGDRILALAGERIRKTLRDFEESFAHSGELLAARFGGDEFAVLAPQLASCQDCLLLAERLVASLSRPYELQGGSVKIAASGGAACRCPSSRNTEDVIRDAAASLAWAKSHSRGSAALCTPSLREQVNSQSSLEREMGRAIERGEFSLAYQPILRLDSGEFEGFEALVRWVHPERGPISPAEFIPLAVESGLIHPLGDWILDRACRDAKEWVRAFPETPFSHFAVNVDRLQLANPTFLARVLEMTGRCSVTSAFLHLEITESGILHDAEGISKRLQRLREQGVRVDLDDFGTGQSSLSCLQDLPIDVVKLDRAFIRRQASREGKRVLWALIELASAFGLDVIAEGIETPEQLHLLASLNCRLGQGFLFSPPLREAQARLILADPTLIQGPWQDDFRLAA